MLFWGATLVVIGVLILLNQVGVVHLRLGEYIGPAILMIIGVRMLVSRKKDKCC